MSLQNHIGDMTRGRRAYPESSVLHSWPIPGSRAFQLPQGEFPCRHRGGHGNPKGAPKEDSFLFCVRCQVLTLLQDHVGKQTAEKRLSELGPSLIPHVRCQLSLADSSAAVGFCCLSCGTEFPK